MSNGRRYTHPFPRIPLVFLHLFPYVFPLVDRRSLWIVLPSFGEGSDDAAVGDELEQGLVTLIGGEAVLILQDEFGEDSLQLLDSVSVRRVR